jgi:hypothetical protein
MEHNARQALSALGMKADVIEVGDIREYAPRGVVFTPALATDGGPKCTGRIPSTAEIQTRVTELVA